MNRFSLDRNSKAEPKKAIDVMSPTGNSEEVKYG